MAHHPRHLTTTSPRRYSLNDAWDRINDALTGALHRAVRRITRADQIEALERITARQRHDYYLAQAREHAAADRAARLQRALNDVAAVAARWEREDRAGDRAPLSKAAAAAAIATALGETADGDA